MTKKILFEPLIHFLLIGALLYLYFNFKEMQEFQEPKQKISVEPYELKPYEEFNNTKLLYEYLLYKKLLLQDAYSLELYKDDKEITAKLLKQAESILEKSSQLQEPSEELLKEFYSAHTHNYADAQSYDIFVMKLKSKHLYIIEKIKSLVDLKPYAQHISSISEQNLQKEFGKYIAHNLKYLTLRTWSDSFIQGESAYLFYIEDKKTSKVYAFEEVEELVYQDYMKLQRIKIKQEAYKLLQERFTILEQ